ncbi:NACHT, LRR and PYD domains-containing protein 1b allele 3-like [Vanacampus margaritifer]
MSTITSTPKMEDDKIQASLQESLKSERRQPRVALMKFLSMPDETCISDHRAHDSAATKMGSGQIKTKRISSFSSWLLKVINDLALHVVNFSFRPSEANDQPDDVVSTELEHTNSNPQIENQFPPHQFSNPLPGIPAATSGFLTGPPPKTIAHVELHPTERRQPSTYTVPAYPHIRYSDRSAWPDDFEHFTPDITLGGPKETYHLQCFRAGRYQCTATGLGFDVDGEGDVRYSVVTWDVDLLQSHCKEPAGPLFDIQCERLTVRRLYLPHCEILSGAEVGHPLSVAHMSGEGLEVITPEDTTHTHVIVKISGCSAFGLMRSEEAPLRPIRALVEISVNPNLPAINVFLLPENVVQDKMRRQRARNNGNERFIDTISDCKLVPEQLYTLTSVTNLENVLIQPDKAPFYRMSHNYKPSFQILDYGNLDAIRLELREFNKDRNLVWSARVPLVEAAQRRCGSLVEHLRNIWSEFIRRVSLPVVTMLGDRLFQARVLGEPDKEALESKNIPSDKARLLLDTVMNKGEEACEMMVMFLRELDPYNADNLGLV